MQQNWWEQDAVVQPAQQPAQQQQFPGVIQGAPAQPDPAEAERLRLAREANERAERAEQRATQNHQRELTEDPGMSATEAERKAGAFLIRALGAAEAYEGAGVGPRTYIGQIAFENAPNVSNYVISDDRQVANSAEDEFIAASLRQDSGAAIPPEELERQRRIYFPLPGDSEAAVEQKRQARLRAIEGLRQSAGRLEPSAQARYDELFAGVDGITEPAQGGGNQGIDELLGGDEARAQDDGVLRGSVSPIYHDAQGNEVGEEYTGPAYDAEGNLYGHIVRDNNGDRQWMTQEAVDRADRLDREQGQYGSLDLMNHGATIGLTDEMNGAIYAGIQALGGDFDVGENYRTARDAEQLRIDRAREREGGMGLVAETFGGISAIGGKAGAVMSAGRQVASRGEPITRGAVQSQIARQSGREGAGVGALAGWSYGRGAEDSSENALIGAGGGYVLGVAGQRGANALANKAVDPARQARAATQRAADDLNIDTIPAMTGGTGTRRVTSGARQGFISDMPIDAAVTRTQSQAGAARRQVAESAGQIVEDADAGELVRSAAKVYSRRTSQIGSNLYRRAERRADGQTFPLTNGVQRADEWLDDLRRSVKGEDGVIFQEVSKLRDQMARGEFDIMAIPRTRDEFRAQFQQRMLRGTTAEKAIGEILDAAEQDILGGLRAVGKDDAANAFETASQFWRTRVETIDEVLEPLLGRTSQRSGEQVISSLERLANAKSGDSARLRRLVAALPDREASSVRATVINRLGRPTAGKGEVIANDSFDLGRFLTQWNNMSPRARRTLFGSDAIESLDKLADVAAGFKRAGSAMNTSNTTGALTAQAAISGGAAWALSPFTAAGITLSQYAAGRLLASPRFARWLAGSTRARTQGAQEKYAKQLGGIARAEPALAREITAFQRALTGANDNALGPARAVAQEPNDEQ